MKRKYYGIGIGLIVIAELLLGGIFQCALGHPYAMVAFAISAMFAILIIGLVSSLDLLYTNSQLDSKRFGSYKMIKLLIAIGLIAYLTFFAEDMEQAGKLEALLRLAALYATTLVFESWLVIDYAKALKQNTETE
ncbi:MAG: hypothetical protein J5808_07900 [Paludibacteraceae bacterium]|nr:hypothetical protein [Paludibacteraceae bacterium]